MTGLLDARSTDERSEIVLESVETERYRRRQKASRLDRAHRISSLDSAETEMRYPVPRQFC